MNRCDGLKLPRDRGFIADAKFDAMLSAMMSRPHVLHAQVIQSKLCISSHGFSGYGIPNFQYGFAMITALMPALLLCINSLMHGKGYSTKLNSKLNRTFFGPILDQVSTGGEFLYQASQYKLEICGSPISGLCCVIGKKRGKLGRRGAQQFRRRCPSAFGI